MIMRYLYSFINASDFPCKAQFSCHDFLNQRVFSHKSISENLLIRDTDLGPRTTLRDACESEIYVNLSFVQLSRLAVMLRVKSPRSGANRHALFIVGGVLWEILCARARPRTGKCSPMPNFLWEFLRVLYPCTHIYYRINNRLHFWS